MVGTLIPNANDYTCISMLLHTTCTIKCILSQAKMTMYLNCNSTSCSPSECACIVAMCCVIFLWGIFAARLEPWYYYGLNPRPFTKIPSSTCTMYMSPWSVIAWYSVMHINCGHLTSATVSITIYMYIHTLDRQMLYSVH